MTTNILDAFSLSGKRALVTGGGRGIGAGMAAALAQAGARVALVSRSEDQLRASAAEIGSAAFPFPADVANTQAFPALLDDVEETLGGGVDIVIHAAGIQHRVPAVDFSPEDWERVVQVDLSAPFFLSQEIGRRQLDRGTPGSHLFIGSLSSHLGLPNVIAYAASKSGLLGVIRTLSLEWASQGIRVNGISPGYVQTDLTKAVFEDPVRREELFSRIPMKRFSTPSDLQGAAVFLASDASNYITGQMLMVDGGWTAA